jgi:tight adherence protein C
MRRRLTRMSGSLSVTSAKERLMIVLRYIVLLLLSLGLAFVVTYVLALPEAALPRHGYKGTLRRLARVESGLFALCEPVICRLSAVVATVPGKLWRARLAHQLEQADGFLGLLVDEFVALCAIGAIGLGGLATFACRLSDSSYSIVLLAATLGAYLPKIQLAETIKQRQKEIRRGLPSAIEIIALCMGAGLDFPASIRLVAEPHKPSRNALKREMRVILEQLELGSTRREALRCFAERVQTDAVRDFVNSVVQAEEKGNPLARVIQIQGRMLSQKRSVLAEEAAARAGVLMIVPMMLLMCCILTLLLGPFIARGGGI